GRLGLVIWPAARFPQADPVLADWFMYFEKAGPSKLPTGIKPRIAGAALCRLGRCEEALKRLGQACKEDPDGGTAREWYFLALTRHALKQPEAARSAVKQARGWMEAQKAGRLKNPRYQGALPVEFWLE